MPESPAGDYLVGRGISDITGEPAGVGMLGYGKAGQRTAGIHTRLRSRAFVFASAGSSDSAADSAAVLLIVNDLPLVFESVHREVLARLASAFGDRYTERNVMITATHTHCGPGGYSRHLLYNTTTGGFRPATFEAIVAGMVEAAQRAHDDLAPSALSLAHGELQDASINRSRAAFDRNPAADRAHFPDAVDPQTTLLGIHRGGRLVGAVNWFATHNTSMTNTNLLISADNKGYAAYHWERLVSGVDYLDGVAPEMITAFAQTNAGDMSPNLRGRPGCGPTDDEFENTRIIGLRQYHAASGLSAAEPPADPVPGGSNPAGPDAAGPVLAGPVDARVTWVHLGDVTVRPEYNGDGRAHRTSPAQAGASSLAGAWVDGPGFPGFRPGLRNPVFDRASGLVYRLSRRLRDSQSPKGLVFPGALGRVLPLVAQRVPVQLLRIGRLYLIGIPGEVTIVAGLRLRRTVAAIVGAPLSDVLVAGYANGYIHYVTTPEEYDAQEYEGGSTLFGRWELGALSQTAATLATAMRDGLPVGRGDPPRPPRPIRTRSRPSRVRPPRGRRFGDVLGEPRPAYAPGERVSVTFAGADPNTDLHRGGTYLEVQRASGDSWVTVADDGDWCTRFHWSARRGGRGRATITWDVPVDTPRGVYRVRYHGDVPGVGGPSAFTGGSRPFEVGPGG